MGKGNKDNKDKTQNKDKKKLSIKEKKKIYLCSWQRFFGDAREGFW